MGELYNPFPKLPKNIRQIGDSDQVVRFYMEDYVNTYLKRLYPAGKQTLRVGVLLGSVEQYDGTPYIFVDGAMEMEDVDVEGEKITFSDSAWKKVYQQMENSFPKRTIQGWFLCGGPGSQLSPLNYWKQHSQYFTGKNQLMYLNHGLEGDEAIYITSEDGFYRLKGHCIYYERNQMMQDYMITRKDVRRVESGAQETVIRDFRSRLSMKKEQAAKQSRMTSAMGMLCGMLTIAVLAGGVALVNNYTKMKQMEGVLASVLPAGVENWSEYPKEQIDEGNFMIIEEIQGHVRPTTSESKIGEKLENDTFADGQAQGADLNVEEVPVDVGVGGDVPSDRNVAGEGNTGISVEGHDADSSGTSSNLLIGMDKENGQGSAADSSLTLRDYEAAAAKGYRIYTVSQGETLYGICLNQYSSLNYLEEICRLNHVTDIDRILAGQKLILP